MIRLLPHDQSVPRESDGAVRLDDIMEEFKKFDGALQWTMTIGYVYSGKRRRTKKRFQYCLNINISKHFLYFRAIQGHSGGNFIDPELQDKVLWPEGFTE